MLTTGSRDVRFEVQHKFNITLSPSPQKKFLVLKPLEFDLIWFGIPDVLIIVLSTFLEWWKVFPVLPMLIPQVVCIDRGENQTWGDETTFIRHCAMKMYILERQLPPKILNVSNMDKIGLHSKTYRLSWQRVP